MSPISTLAVILLPAVSGAGLRSRVHSAVAAHAQLPSWTDTTPLKSRIPDESSTCYLYQGGFDSLPEASCCTATGFGKYSCKGPCYNGGCPTVCTTKVWHEGGAWQEGTVSCKGSGGNVDYVCCPPKKDPLTGVTWEAKCMGSCSISSSGGPVSGTCCCNAKSSTVVEVNNFKYSTAALLPTDPTGMGSSLSATANFYGCNYGPGQKNIGSLTFSVSETQTSSHSFSSTTGMTVATTLKTGVPFIVDGEVKVGLSESIGYGTSNAKSATLNTAVSTGAQTVGPYSRQEIQFASETEAYTIPFTATATVVDNCGTRSYKEVGGTVKVSGVAAHADGAISTTFGPAIPTECESPFGTPINEQSSKLFCPTKPSDSCQANPICARDSSLLGEDCQCTTNQSFSCCSTAQAHPKCSSYPKNTLLCPNANGYFDPCCSGGASLLQASSFSTSQLGGKRAPDAQCGSLSIRGSTLQRV